MRFGWARRVRPRTGGAGGPILRLTKTPFPGYTQASKPPTMPGMITQGPPPVASLERFLVSQIGSDFSYPRQGCSLGSVPAPAGYRHDRAQGLIGHGEMAFLRARRALQNWLMFDQPGVLVYPPESPVVPGCHVVVAGSVGPLWVTGACRIVDVIDEDARYGFAYGTLDHPVQGEELFLVTRRPDGSVWFNIDVYSRAQKWYVQAITPLFRSMQNRFRQQAIAAMALASRESSSVS